MHKLKVLLVIPYGADVRMGIPLAFAYLRGNTSREKYEFEVLDCSLEELCAEDPRFAQRIKESRAQVVGFTSWSLTFPEVVKALKVIKQTSLGTITVLGGPHASAYGEKVMANNELDFLFRGEAEFQFEPFLDEICKEPPARDFSKISGLCYRDAHGEIRSNGLCLIDNLDDLKLPDYKFIGLNRYIKNGYRHVNSKPRCAPIMATRGCPYSCQFCSAPIIAGRKIRMHSIEYLMRWVKTLYEEHRIRGFILVDDNFTFYPEYAKEFCKAFIALGYKDVEVSTPVGIRMQRGDKELWHLMKKAGWKMQVIAPESGSPRMLKIMKKKLNPEIVPGIVRDIRQAGLMTQGYFMTGYPGETLEDIRLTEQFIKEVDFDIVTLFNFQPLPGTPIYDQLMANKEISGPIALTRTSFAERSYLPKDTKDYNYSLLYVRLLLLCFVRHPVNFIVMLQMRGPWQAFGVFFSHIKAAFAKSFRS